MSLAGDSPCSESDSLLREMPSQRTIFICGFIPKRWHNSSLQSIALDLLPDYFVGCNRAKWDPNSSTRTLLANAEALIFFVNEFTLADLNCLITLQYAWHLMIPVIMLRPPRTKLVICARNKKRGEIKSCRLNSDGSIVRNPNSTLPFREHSTYGDIDYGLLQDVLYHGYRLSIVYDRLEHKKSMEQISARLAQVIKPTQLHFNRSPFTEFKESADTHSNDSSTHNSLSIRRYDHGSRKSTSSSSNIKIKRGLNNNLSDTRLDDQSMRHSQSTGSLSNLNRIQRSTSTPHPGGRSAKGGRAAPVRVTPGALTDTDRSSQSQASRGCLPSLASNRSFSFERRMSMSSLDDMTNFQSTQYLVFPMKDSNKKPTLIKFPEDLVEESYKQEDSVWGSDTSLEEEAEIAPTIRGQFSIDETYESPLSSPAPYVENLA